MINLYIVILNWNRKKDTLECLRSLDKCKLEKDGLTLKVTALVVDNASTDGSAKAIREAKLKNINKKILRNKKNMGFASGNNEGIKYCLENMADYILVLNNDTLAAEELFVEFVQQMENMPKTGIASGKIYFAPGYEFHKDRYNKENLGKVLWYAGGRMDWENVMGQNRGVDEIDVGQYNQSIRTDFATGACCILRPQALRETGLFDQKYFMYLEDADLSQRMKKKNWQVYYFPKAIIWHKVAQSSGVGSELNDYYISRNRMLFGFKYAQTRTKIALVKESIRLLIIGRKWQRKGVRDFYLRRFGKGSWN